MEGAWSGNMRQGWPWPEGGVMQITCQGSPLPPFYREEAELWGKERSVSKVTSKMGAGIGDSAQAWGSVPFPSHVLWWEVRVAWIRQRLFWFRPVPFTFWALHTCFYHLESQCSHLESKDHRSLRLCHPPGVRVRIKPSDVRRQSSVSVPDQNPCSPLPGAGWCAGPSGWNAGTGHFPRWK